MKPEKKIWKNHTKLKSFVVWLASVVIKREVIILSPQIKILVHEVWQQTAQLESNKKKGLKTLCFNDLQHSEKKIFCLVLVQVLDVVVVYYLYSMWQYYCNTYSDMKYLRGGGFSASLVAPLICLYSSTCLFPAAASTSWA